MGDDGNARRRKITIVIPCFNERETILQILDRVKRLPIDKCVIVIDNCSTDGTAELLRSACSNERRLESAGSGPWVHGQRRMDGDGFVLVLQPKNLEKGTSVKTGLALACSDYVICQDADLEYDPADIPKLLEHAEHTGVAAVFGSRMLDPSRAELPLSAFQLGRAALTKMFNVLYGAQLTDISTCYKLLRTDVARSLNLQTSGFDLDFEIPARLHEGRHVIAELPISYFPRDRAHGKKIRWRDGLSAARTLLTVRMSSR